MRMMKTFRILVPALLCLFSIVPTWAQSRDTHFWLDARTSFAGGVGETSRTGFTADYVNIHATGSLCDNIRYRFRQRLTKPVFSKENPLNGTDLLFLDWIPSKQWDFAAGKLPVLIGGFEWDDAPIDVYYWNGYCNHVWEVYSLGVQATFHPAPGQGVTFQLVDSPWSRNIRNCYAWNLCWHGHFAPWWHTIWSVNYMDDVFRKGITYLSLGNRLERGRWAAELDWMDRGGFRGDWSFTGRLVYDTGRWNLFAKGGYDINKSCDRDVLVPVGFEYVFGGGGVEYFPLHHSRDIRLHAVVWGDNLAESLRFSFGITFQLHLLSRS